MNLLEEIDELLASLEDTAHGEEGKRITEMRSRIQAKEKELYSKIENLIIIWSNDGTKTAGSLTREIMDLL